MFSNLRFHKSRCVDLVTQAGLDSSKIGTHIASGMQHHVYRYGKNKVIKIPRHNWFMFLYGQFTYQEVKHEIQLIEQYFPEFMIPTQVLQSGSSYVIVQDYLPKYSFLRVDDLSTHKKQQVKALLQSNKKMIEETGYCIDLWGNIGLQISYLSIYSRAFSAHMRNVLSSKLDIKIIDTNLSYLESDSLEFSMRHIRIDKILRLFSRKIEKHYFEK